jgi:DNA polymerase elongation subunit (family B)
MTSKDDTIIFDIETKTFGRPDKDKDRLRVFICYSYKTNKIYFLKTKEDIQRAINAHKYLVGFNIFEYDNPILMREGIWFGKEKIMIDIYDIFKKRASQMKIDKGMLGDLFMEYSLDYISKTVGVADIDTGKMKIDYSLFRKDIWTSEEWDRVCEYGKRDVMVTKRLYEWLEQYFEAFKSFLYEEDMARKVYLTSSLAKYTYKAICKEMKWNESYNSHSDTEEEGIKGGYVSYPAGEKFKNVKVFDFVSLYPSIMIQCNLYGMQTDDNRPAWNGNNIWKTEGKYYSDEMAGVGKLLKRWFADRIIYKDKGDKREYTIKIMLNTCFSYDTEIITIDGIKNIQECKVGDKVFSINKETGKTEIKEITATQAIKYSGDMVNFDNCNMNLMVTPDHNMIHTSHGHYRKKIFFESNKIYTSKAIDMYKKYVKYPNVLPIEEGEICEKIDMKNFADENYIWMIKLHDSYSQRKNKNLQYIRHLRMHLSLNNYDKNLNGQWFIQGRKNDIKIKKYLDIKEFMYFIGIYIAEGCCGIIKPKKYENGNVRGTIYRIDIGQYESVNFDIKNKIRNVLKNLGFRFSEHKKGFIICSKFLYDFVQQFGKYQEDRMIPSWIFKYDKTILEKLYEGMYDGDGTKSQNRYTTNSIKLRDDYIKLNLYLGYRCYYGYDSNCWRIYRVRRTQNIPENNFISKNNSDMVYCVTVEDNHTLMAGRNGRFQWTGQCYGILDQPYYAKTYNKIAAGDCTRLGRQWIKYASKIFRENGYPVVANDTDSVFLVDELNDNDRLIAVKDKILEYIKSTVPFLQDIFDMKLEAELKYLYFFKGEIKNEDDSELDEEDKINKAKGFMKKNYIMVTKDDKVIIKNLGIRKKSNSPLSKKIFWECLVPEIKNGKSKFKKTYIRNLIFRFLKEDITLAALRKEVGTYEQYEKTSPNSLSAQIAKEYGPGIHFLIPNNIGMGVGKGKKYCTVEMFKANKMKMEHIDTDNFWKELEYFIAPAITKNIFDYEEKI